MNYVQKLGKSISRLGFGGAAISGEGKGYGFGQIDDSEARRLLLKAFEEGINLYDFAPIYGFNMAEKRAGEAFKHIREKVYLISKSGVDWHDNLRVNMSNEPKVALKMLDQTLKNFQSDYVDIYLVHWPDPKVDIRSTLDALYTAKIKGKIHHLGLCNTNLEELKKAKEVCPVDVIQMELNFFNQNNFKNLETELSPGNLTMGWGTFDKGVLAGSVSKDRKFEDSDCRSWAPWWKKSDWKKRVELKDRLAKRFHLSAAEMAQLALRFSQENCDVSLCGMKNSSYMKDNLSYLRERTDDRLEEIAGEFSRL